MPYAIRCLTVLACALVAVAGCGGGQLYRLEWNIADTVTLAPGESIEFPITVRRVAPQQGEVLITLDNAPAGVTLTPSEFSIPQGEDSVSVTATLAVAADTPAQNLQSVTVLLLVARDPSNGVTSGARVYLSLIAPPTEQPDFSITVEPREVSLFAGQSRQVPITVERAPDFSGPLSITLDSPNEDIQAKPLTLAGDQTTGTLSVNVHISTSRMPAATRIVATSEDGRSATTGFTFNIR